MEMSALKAHVKDGKLILDDPSTDLPDGAQVELYVLHDDEFDPDERERLHESIREGIEQMKGGGLIDADDAMAVLRRR